MNDVCGISISDRALRGFWDRVDRGSPDECWEYRGKLNERGYGVVSIVLEGRRRTTRGAHRLAYELLVGPIFDGLHLDHLCLNKSCVNPAHLEPVTLAENNRRNYALIGLRGAPLAKQLQTHCKRGHLLPPPKDGLRICRPCTRIGWHRRKATA